MKAQLEITCDQTLDQPLEILEVAKTEDRSVDRLLKIHEAAELELRDLEADFQFRLQEAESHFARKLAAARQDFQCREQEIQAIAKQRFQRTTDEFDAERRELQQRIAALEEEIAGFRKAEQQVIRTPLSRQLEMQLDEVTREKARLEEELQEANHRRKADGHRLERLKTSKALPHIWEL